MRRLPAAIVAAVAAALANLGAAAEHDKPAVVCESDASGQAMHCREAWPGEDAAPFRRVTPAATTPTGAAAKPAQPLLASPPSRTPPTRNAPDYLRGPRVDPVQPAASEPTLAAAVQAPTAAKPPLAAATTMRAKSASGPASAGNASRDGIAKDTAPAATPAVQPASAAAALTASAAAVAVTPPAPINASEAATAVSNVPPAVAVETGSPGTTAASDRTVAAPTETARNAAVERVAVPPPPAIDTAPAASSATALLGQREFASLDGSRYTLELANARSAAPLRELAARLALDGEVYLVHLRNPDADRWLLAWSDHASQAEARSARQRVPADPAINSGWPRRLAPLQNELVAP